MVQPAAVRVIYHILGQTVPLASLKLVPSVTPLTLRFRCVVVPALSLSLTVRLGVSQTWPPVLVKLHAVMVLALRGTNSTRIHVPA